MGRVKFNLPNLVKNKRPTFRPRKIIFFKWWRKTCKDKREFFSNFVKFLKEELLVEERDFHSLWVH